MIVLGWVHGWLQGRQPDISAAHDVEPFVIGRLLEGVQNSPAQPERAAKIDDMDERLDAVKKSIEKLHDDVRAGFEAQAKDAAANVDFLRSEVVGGQTDIIQIVGRYALAAYEAAERAHKTSQQTHQTVETALSRKSGLAGSMMTTHRQAPTRSGVPPLVQERNPFNGPPNSEYGRQTN
jgi:hypothetical protein